MASVLATAPALAVQPNSPYGVVAFIPSPNRFDAMREANIVWGRYDFSWRSIESAGKGSYNWAVQDYAVAQANARGLKIYASLGYTPAWASASGNANSPPANLQDWYDYVYACVSRYKGSIKHWEIWNEPNLSQFWAGTRAQYIELLKVGADAAHAADPDCMVLGPELSSAGPASTWMTEVLTQAGNKIDIISFHQYDGRDTPSGRLSAMDAMHNTIVNLGYGNKPIWITESGFRSDATGMTEQKQGEYLTAMLAGVASRPWVKKFFWYQIWEGGAGTEKWGLLREDESRKPSWQAYHDYTAAHPAPEMISVNLSTTDITDGLRRVEVADGHTTADTRAGRRCRRNSDPAGGDYYIYFDVNDSFAFEGGRPVVIIDVDYYDLGTGTLTLQYDSIDGGAYKVAGSVTLGNKDTWKQATFYIDDAYFGNRQNNGADFRVSAGEGVSFYLDVVQVSAARVIPEPGLLPMLLPAAMIAASGRQARQRTGGWSCGSAEVR
ncbi:GH39 family glycosyl hydrolase [Fontivita pretiosa]|uniref:GH39 family glycosyl hydrolase n=1 Tax=Fontivita pretiosa TaxID=2989684 RepID=UPI003D171F93